MICLCERAIEWARDANCLSQAHWLYCSKTHRRSEHVYHTIEIRCSMQFSMHWNVFGFFFHWSSLLFLVFFTRILTCFFFVAAYLTLHTVKCHDFVCYLSFVAADDISFNTIRHNWKLCCELSTRRKFTALVFLRSILTEFQRYDLFVCLAEYFY